MNEAEFSICPIQLLLCKVYGQTVGPINVDVHYHFPVRDKDTKVCELTAKATYNYDGVFVYNKNTELINK